MASMKFVLIILSTLLLCDCKIVTNEEASVETTAPEKRSFSSWDMNNVCQTMWNKDKNRVTWNSDIAISTQSHASSGRNSPNPLFKYVNHVKLSGKYKVFKDLLHLYKGLLNNHCDYVIRQKLVSKAYNFLDSIKYSGPMEEARKFLFRHNFLKYSSAGYFKNELYKLWFYKYSRSANPCSSGFEHVFFGEIDKSKGTPYKVKGFHNWIQYYDEEKAGNMDYESYHVAKTYQEPRQLAVKSSWHNAQKYFLGMFVGTSPEFEMALYTLCFLTHPNGSCSCSINGQKVTVRTYEMYGKYVGTAFPDV